MDVFKIRFVVCVFDASTLMRILQRYEISRIIIIKSSFAVLLMWHTISYSHFQTVENVKSNGVVKQIRFVRWFTVDYTKRLQKVF